MLFRWFGTCTGRAPVQGQAGPSWQDGADVWILTSTVVCFLGRLQSESLPMQDEPERRALCRPSICRFRYLVQFLNRGCFWGLQFEFVV
jgi:hypothetical protein